VYMTTISLVVIRNSSTYRQIGYWFKEKRQRE
jgi:hypothetical protein